MQNSRKDAPDAQKPKRRIGQLPKGLKGLVNDEEECLRNIENEENLNDYLRRKRGPKNAFGPTSDDEYTEFLEEQLKKKEAEEKGKVYKPRNYYEENKPFNWKDLFLFLFGGGWATKVIVFSLPTICILTMNWNSNIIASFGIMGVVIFLLVLYYCIRRM